MTATAYLRISTDHQDEASQRQQIAELTKSTGLVIDREFAETASGGTPWQERMLATLLRTASAGDTIVVSEISRIARSTVGVLTFLQAAAAAKINVIAVRNKLVLDDSLHSKITVTVLALAAEIERDLLRERTKAALAARRAAGLPLGRPRGSISSSVLEPRAAEIEKALSAKISKRGIARMLGCSPGTLYAYLSRRADTIDAHSRECNALPLNLGD